MKFLIILLIFLSSTSMTYAEEYFIDIPFGAYNPKLDTPAEEWYEPSQKIVLVGDNIIWYNSDKESHSVTSGEGPGRFNWMNNKDFGEPDGIFDSGLFKPSESWNHTFEEAGIFSYYCIIHPWMEGLVIVEKVIPDFPHDATGKEVQFPLLQYTPDMRIEVNLSWDPPTIKIHEKIQFVYQFYDVQTNSNLANMNYAFVIYQNGQEIFRDKGVNQIGGDYRNFIFTESGSIIIRIEKINSSAIFAEESVTVFGEVQNKEQRSVDFTAVVYDNSEKITHGDYHIKPAQRMQTYYELMVLLIFVPAVLFIIALLWLKKKPELPKTGNVAYKR